MHARSLLLLALAASLLSGTSAVAQDVPLIQPRETFVPAPPRTIVVTDADNKGNITLRPGDALRVQLSAPNPSEYEWCHLDDGATALTRTIWFPNISDSFARRDDHHLDTTMCFFNVPDKTRIGSTEVLRFVYVSPDGPGTPAAKTWQIHVLIAASPVKRLP